MGGVKGGVWGDRTGQGASHLDGRRAPLPALLLLPQPFAVLRAQSFASCPAPQPRQLPADLKWGGDSWGVSSHPKG